MGEVSETTTTTMTTTTKRKKKGRPSLLDLQKRSLKKQQKHHQNPNYPNSNSNDEDERILKKQKLLQAFNSNLQNLNPPALFPNSNSDPLSHPIGSDHQYVSSVSSIHQSNSSSIPKPFQFQLHHIALLLFFFFFNLISGISRVILYF